MYLIDVFNKLIIFDYSNTDTYPEIEPEIEDINNTACMQIKV